MLEKFLTRSIIMPVIAIILSIIVGIAPIISVIIASAIAKMNNCTLHEGFVNPCIVWGVDMGHTLYSMSVMGWLALISVPIGAMGLLVSIVWLLVVIFSRK